MGGQEWKILAATTALAAAVIATTTSLPVFARELQPLATAAPEQVGMSAERLGRITTVLKKEIADGKLPGAVVMVARKGRIVYSDAIGFQDKGANTPMTPDAIFRIYSMTKPLASVAAMTLVEDGVIQLTDPIAKFLPAFKDMQVSVASTGADGKATYTNVPAGRPIIVQDLLRHSAGLAYAEITKNEPVKAAYVAAKFSQPGVHEYDSRGMTPAEQVERIAKAPLIHQPGTVWEYSMAVDILGRVVEAASGKRLAVVLDERLFKPLKMVDSSFWLPASKMLAPRAAAAGRPGLGPEDQRARCVGGADERFRWRRCAFDRHGLSAVRTDAAEWRRARRRARGEPLHHQADDVGPSRHARRGAVPAG